MILAAQQHYVLPAAVPTALVWLLAAAAGFAAGTALLAKSSLLAAVPFALLPLLGIPAGPIVSATTNRGPFSDTGTYGYAGPGFEFRAESGFTFRGTAYGLFSGNGFFIWPGLTLAYAF